jgi:hypothetical protein
VDNDLKTTSKLEAANKAGGMIGRRWKMSTVSTSNGIFYLSHRLFFIIIIIFSSLPLLPRTLRL